MQIRKNRRTPAGPAPETRSTAEESLAWAAGAQQFRHRDPLYHVTESFQQSFDRIGREHARQAAGGVSQPETDAGAQRAGQEKKSPMREQGGVGREDGGQALWTGNAPSALTAFSETTFQRGAMSAAVLNGTGKMMLTSCLKRTVGESGPKRLQQQTLLGTGSQLRNIPGHSPDQMVFNRSFAKGALGIVVDTIRDARRVVDSMADMAQGTGELHGGDSETLRTMYPFLDVSREIRLEAEYRQKLANCTDAREKPILQNALVQVLSLKAKKAQMKNEFVNKLRFLSDRATETLAELEAPDALDEIVSSAWGDMAATAAENPGEGTENNAPDGSESGFDAPDLEGRGTGATETEPDA